MTSENKGWTQAVWESTTRALTTMDDQYCYMWTSLKGTSNFYCFSEDAFSCEDVSIFTYHSCSMWTSMIVKGNI